MQAWIREAQIKHLTDRMMDIQAVRIGMAEPKDYRDVIHELRLKLEILQYGKEEVVKRSIEELKAMKTG